MYLNTAEYGSNSYGIKVAAKTYFDKLPSELNYNESSIIVGLLNKPTKYNPYFNPDNAIDKSAEIFYNLFKYEIDSVLSASIESVGFTILVELIWSFGFKSSRNKAANDNARKTVNSQ